MNDIIRANKEEICPCLAEAELEVDVDDYITRETDELLTESNEEYAAEIARLGDLRREVLTMLKPCEDYEQAQGVLFAYNIIDADGRLIKPE